MDLTADTHEFNLSIDEFDFGIRLEFTNKDQFPDIQENLDQYVYISLTQNEYAWDKASNGNSS